LARIILTQDKNGFWNPYVPLAVKALPRWGGLPAGLDSQWNIWRKLISCLFGKK
jgi:hypothetical protein